MIASVVPFERIELQSAVAIQAESRASDRRWSVVEHHGFPSMEPGVPPGWWQFNADYCR